MDMLSTIVAVAGLVAALLLAWKVRTVPVAVGSPGEPAPAELTVVIPARNEVGRLPRLLRSLADQDTGRPVVVVVDDGSDDGTSDLAASIGAHVVRTDGPPAGWAGKPWACTQGVEAVVAAAAPLLVFLDADTWLAPDGLGRLAAAHAALAPDGLLSVQPYHRTERVYEQLSAVANVVPVLASGLAAIRPAVPSAVAFGPCLVTTPEALTAVGGFAAVKRETVEDVALAHCYRDAGRPVRCLAGGSTVMFRMYADGLGALAAGWSKNLAGGASRAARVPTVGAVLWVAGALAGSVGLVVSPSWLGLALYGAYAAELWWMLRRIGRFQWWTPLLFPVPVVAFVLFFIRSVVLRNVRRSVDWRGRRIRVGNGPD